MSSDSGLLTYDGYDVYYIDVSEYVSTGTLLQYTSAQFELMAPFLLNYWIDLDNKYTDGKRKLHNKRLSKGFTEFKIGVMPRFFEIN